MKCTINNCSRYETTKILTDIIIITDKSNSYSDGMRISMVYIYIYICNKVEFVYTLLRQRPDDMQNDECGYITDWH